MRRRLRRALVEALLLGLAVAATLVISLYFAPRGFNGGFTDMAHDGYQLRQVLDLERGKTIFKDTYDQYGPLGGYLNLAGFELFGRRLLGIKYAMCAWYAAIATVLYLCARHFLGPLLSAFAILVWLSLAPFYQHGIMISPHVYVLFFQALVDADAPALGRSSADGSRRQRRSLRRDLSRPEAVGGVPLRRRRRRVPRQSGREAAGAGTHDAARADHLRLVVGVRRRRGVGTPVVLGRAPGLVPASRQVSPGGLLGIAGGTDPEPYGALGSLLGFPARFIQAHQYEQVAYYWYVPRAVLAGAAIALWRGRDTTGEKVLLVASITLVLWAAAFPSANYMHQWWTISLGIGAFVYCVRVGVGRAIDRLPHWRLHAALPTTIAVVSLAVWPGVRERVDAAIGRALIQRQTINEPWVISGIKTDDRTSVALGALYESMVSFRERHPTTRVVSIDRSDGWTHGIAESLLWLSFFEPNEHAHPVYWSCPVLTTVIYPPV